MPSSVLAAYRDPVDLRGLLTRTYLASSGEYRTVVYDDRARAEVLGVLLDSLSKRHGDVWVEIDGSEDPVSRAVRRMSRVEDAISLLCEIDEYGGPREVLPLLAKAMQYGWARWWESFEWLSIDDVWRWRLAAELVLGTRQFTWLSAQFARTALGLAAPLYRADALRAIVAAEAYAETPSGYNRGVARSRADTLQRVIIQWEDEAREDYDVSVGVEAAHDAARAAASGDGSIASRFMTGAASAAAGSSEWRRGTEVFSRLGELTKRLITPTLVTEASGRLRSRRL